MKSAIPYLLQAGWNEIPYFRNGIVRVYIAIEGIFKVFENVELYNSGNAGRALWCSMKGLSTKCTGTFLALYQRCRGGDQRNIGFFSAPFKCS